MENQTKPKYSDQITQAAKAFTAFGLPKKIIMDGADITAEVIENFNGIDAWLRRLAVAWTNFRITSYVISRINGDITLYVKSVY